MKSATLRLQKGSRLVDPKHPWLTGFYNIGNSQHISVFSCDMPVTIVLAACIRQALGLLVVEFRVYVSASRFFVAYDRELLVL